MSTPNDSAFLRFGNYEVLSRPDGAPDEIGRGGFGRTYRARHSFLGTEVALKVIHDRLTHDEAAKARFLKEAQEHARLGHPGIARITDFGEMDGTFFYAMELCRDGDLQEFVRKRGRLPPPEALQLIRQTAEALQFAHSCGIVHRDIKPSNILLVFDASKHPQVKIIDFGLVKRLVRGNDEAGENDAPSLWSPAFASPQQIRELPLDERTDIFSLGMTAWFLMAGSGPVEGTTTEIVKERLDAASYEPRLPAALTGRMRGIVARMLEKDAAKRYRSCGELLEELREVLNEGLPAREPRHAPVPLAERFTLQPAARAYLGEVFRGRDRQRQVAVRITLIYAEHTATVIEQVAQRVRTLAAAQPPGLVTLLEMTKFAEGWAVVEEDVSGLTVAEVLRREGAVSLAKVAGVLWDAATGLDAAIECGAAPVPLEHALLEGVPEQGPVDWSIVNIRIPLQLVAPESDWSDGADVTNDPALASPLKAFAGLVYLAVGGRHVRTSALYSSTAGTAIAGLGSAGNQMLAACLAGESTPAGCRALLQSLCAHEGLPADGVARRAMERRQKTQRAQTTGHAHGTAQRTTTAPAAGTQTAALERLEAAAREAKEMAEQAWRVKLPPGVDDYQLCQHQMEAHRASREAASAKQQAHELHTLGRLDQATSHKLTEVATAASAAASRALEAARKLVPAREAPRPEMKPSPVSQPPPAPPPVVSAARPVEADRQKRPDPAAPVAAIPVQRKSGRRAALVLTCIVAAIAAGAGAWVVYNEQKSQKGRDGNGAAEKTADEAGPLGSEKTPEKGPLVEEKPPALRQFVVTFSGELPDKDSEIQFTGTSAMPKVERRDGTLIYTFALEKDAGNPEAVVDAKEFQKTELEKKVDRLEYKLTRSPRASVRIKITGTPDAPSDHEPGDPLALTIGGKHGKLKDGTLIFDNVAAAADGSFRLDLPAYRLKQGKLESGVYKSELELVTKNVKLVKSGARMPWTAVIFEPVNSKSLPELNLLKDQLGALSVGATDLKFSIDPDAAEPSVILPAGDYKVSWQRPDSTLPHKGESVFTVDAEKENNELPMPRP